MRGLATHVGTSGDGALFGLVDFDAGTGLGGVPLGETASGNPFAYDPFDAYRAGLVTNPNLIVTGAIGSGKSSVVKMMVARARARNRRVVVVDPKGEYRALVETLGGSYWRLGENGWCTPFLGGDAIDVDAALSAWSLASGRALLAKERVMATHLVRTTRSSRPLPEWRERGGREMPEDLRAGLDRLIDGDLAGIFDGPGDPVELDSGLTVVDVSSYWGRESLALAALAAVSTARGSSESTASHVIIDEAWAVLNDESTLTWLRGSWKLARARAMSHILVLHRFGDVAAVSGVGSAERARAESLVRDCDTAVIMRQGEGDEGGGVDLVGANETRRRLVRGLRRGEALWRTGSAWSLVRLRPTDLDRRLIDTDERMRRA